MIMVQVQVIMEITRFKKEENIKNYKRKRYLKLHMKKNYKLVKKGFVITISNFIKQAYN